MPPVLIVENDPGNRFTLQQLLTMQGYEVEAVESGAEALRCLPTRPTGIVVLDYRMPEIDGGDVIRFIAGDPALARCQAVILVTASPYEVSPSTHLLLDALEAPLLSKPFITDTLLAALQAATGRLRQRGCLPAPVAAHE